jgi:hypothetical protein
MQIRIRATGAVMYEAEFRAYIKANDGPTWGATTEEILDSLGADVVFEGPQATGGTVYQFSMPDGVEQIDGKWYTKHVLGPVFADTTDAEGNVTTAADNEAAYKAAKDAEQAKSVRTSRDSKLAETDWVVIKATETGTPVPEAIALERQALRDITEQAGFPWTVQWPTQPLENEQ